MFRVEPNEVLLDFGRIRIVATPIWIGLEWERVRVGRNITCTSRVSVLVLGLSMSVEIYDRDDVDGVTMGKAKAAISGSLIAIASVDGTLQ